jgi:putative SOS response-associated peptidase YedK
MCGRYAAARSVDDIAGAFGIRDDDLRAVPAADWNVAPTKDVPVVVEHQDRRVLTLMRWGLVPSWADDPTVGVRMINARVETVREKPAFRDAVERRRCLLPADGWYEWQVRPDGVRQPYFLRLRTGEGLAFAGVWDAWLDGEGRRLVSTAILTGAAPEDLAGIHDRAPVVLSPEEWAGWLAAGAVDPHLLHATPAGVIEAAPVGPEVGDVRNNGPQLTVPVRLDEQTSLF